MIYIYVQNYSTSVYVYIWSAAFEYPSQCKNSNIFKSWLSFSIYTSSFNWILLSNMSKNKLDIAILTTNTIMYLVSILFLYLDVVETCQKLMLFTYRCVFVCSFRMVMIHVSIIYIMLWILNNLLVLSVEFKMIFLLNDDNFLLNLRWFNLFFIKFWM